MLLLCLYFPNSTTACRLDVFGLNLLYNRLSTFFGVGSPYLYLYHSEATTEEILVRSIFNARSIKKTNKKINYITKTPLKREILNQVLLNSLHPTDQS